MAPVIIRRAVPIILLSILTAGLTACVRSKVMVTSEPPEATVTMNGVELGETPVEQPFTWYWYYDFIATKEGYETTGLRERFRTPIYLFPPLDLLMEMMPFYVIDRREVHIVLPRLEERPEPVLAEGAGTETINQD